MDSQKTVNKNTLNVVKDLLAMGIFRCERKILIEIFKEMGENDAANLLEKTSDEKLQDLHESLTSVSHSPANLIVMYAGPGAGKSTVTNYLFERIPLKWLVVLATRDIRISEGESVGNPFSKYNMKWEEFDSIPDDDPNYIKTISTDENGQRTKGYVVDLNESRKLLSQGYNLIIHSWIWREFLERSSAFENTLTMCLYVDYSSTVKRLAYRNLIEAREKNLLSETVISSFPKDPNNTDINWVLKVLHALQDNKIYQDLLLRIDSAKQTQAKYDTVLKSRDVSFFKYIVDNSGELSKAQKDVEAVVIADRYKRLAKKYKKFPEYFKKIVSRAQALESKKWKDY